MVLAVEVLLDSAREPDQYADLLDLRANANPSLGASPRVLFTETAQVNAIEQCDALRSTVELSRGSVTEIVSFPARENSLPKRKRVTYQLDFSAGNSPNDTRHNQGPGGDLSLLPSCNPVIGKQSCSYCANDMSNKQHHWQVCPRHVMHPAVSFSFCNTASALEYKSFVLTICSGARCKSTQHS